MLPANWLTLLIGVALATMSALSVWRWVAPRLRMLRGDDAGLRTMRLLIGRGADLAAPPAQTLSLRLIRLARTPGELVLLLMNEGGTAQDVRVELTDGTGDAHPSELWRGGEPGHVRLRTVGEPDEVTIVVRYEDPAGRAHADTYRCSVPDGTLTQL